MIHIDKKQLEIIQRQQLEKLINKAGTIAHLARMLDEDYMTVKGWVNRGRISKNGALKVEENKELRKHFTALNLRPDLHN